MCRESITARVSVCRRAVLLGGPFPMVDHVRRFYCCCMEKEFWNERYASDGLVYGEAPNEFLVSVADRLPKKGRAIDIGAGEGRNAIYLASLGLDVMAMDQSEVGMRKAMERAKGLGLSLRTSVADLQDFDAGAASLDVVTSFFVHLPSALRALVHGRVREWLRPGGVFVLEAYAPEQLSRNTGGPRDIARLASLETVVKELEGLVIEHRAALVRNVSEGQFHSGEAAVVQVVARKT